MPDPQPHLFVLFRDGRFAGMSLNMEDANALAEHTVKGAEIVRYVPIDFKQEWIQDLAKERDALREANSDLAGKLSMMTRYDIEEREKLRNLRLRIAELHEANVREANND